MAEQNQENSSEGQLMSEEALLQLINHCKTLGESGYTLPVASADILGGIKVGDGLAIDSGGTLSTSSGGGGMTLADSSDTTVTSIDLSDYSGTNKKILLTCVLSSQRGGNMCVSQILDFSLETESPSPVPGGETTYSLWHLLGSFTGFFTLNYLTFYVDCFIGHVENGTLTVKEDYYQSDTQGEGVNQNTVSNFQCNILKYRVYEIN